MQELVERWYSSAVYPLIQRFVTPASNVLPFALLDVLVLALLGVAVFLCLRVVRARGKRARAAAQSLGILLAGLAASYVLFQLLWGLNYQRVRLSEKLV